MSNNKNLIIPAHLIKPHKRQYQNLHKIALLTEKSDGGSMELYSLYATQLP